VADDVEIALVEHVAPDRVRVRATSVAVDTCVVNWNAIEAYVLARSWAQLDLFCRRIARTRLAGTGGSLKSRGGWVLETASCLMQAGGRSATPAVTKADGERKAHGLLVELASERISYVSHSDHLRIVAVDWVGLRTSLEIGDTKSVGQIVASISEAVSTLDKHLDLLVEVLQSVDAFVQGEWEGELATLGRGPTIDELFAEIGR